MATQTKSQIDLDDLTRNIVENLENVLHLLGISDYNVYPNRIAFACPIHGGDNESGCCIFTDGDDTLGNWVCWTRGCHEERFETKDGKENIGNNIFGFIRALIGEDGKPATYSQAISWAIKATNCDVSKVSNNNNRDFVTLNRKVQKEDYKPVGTHSRQEVRKHLLIPAKYYVDLGYSKEVLDKYDVGFCNIKGNKMYLRAVAPVYDDNFKFIGCCGRSIQPSCPKCKYYHFPNRECPKDKIEQVIFSKWRNSNGQFAGSSFYNSWFAIPHIYETGTVILTEGCSDVWRAVESDIHFILGMFKTMTTEAQDNILKKLPISNVIIASDGDAAGQEGKQKLIEKYSRYYNIYEPNLNGKDLGDMQVEELKDTMQPIFNKIGLK